MPDRQDSIVFRIVKQDGPGGRLVLEAPTAAGRRRIVVAGYEGPALPASLRDPVIDAGAAAGQWRLSAAEGTFGFHARTIDRIDERPRLYEPLHLPFALSGTDRAAVRVLLWLLRLPGGARLLRRWHAGRSG
ncbi:MAG: hypothetical protein ACT4UQ_10700 [Gammaproteobacteria bacterium]